MDAWRLIIAVRGDQKATGGTTSNGRWQKAYAEQTDADHGGRPRATLCSISQHDGLRSTWGASWQRDARHVALWGKWLFWTGPRWEPDERLDPHDPDADYLRAACRRASCGPRQRQVRRFDVDKAEADRQAAAFGAHGGQRRRARAQQRGAGRDCRAVGSRPVPARHAGRHGRPAHRRAAPGQAEDYITKITAVAPAPPGTPAPIWQAFLERIFRHDPELVPFVQRALGYSLLGAVSEHVLLFCWGQGGNGKGVLLNTVSRILGDYAAVAPSDLLLVTQSDRHPCDMAMLRGARMVTAQELAPGRAWDEPKLKSLTGGDPITARFMRQDFFTYEPQFTLWVAGNHKPVPGRRRGDPAPRPARAVPAGDPGGRARPDSAGKLKAEWPAILRWAIDGCLAWQREGLTPPASALAATKDYLDAEDTARPVARGALHRVAHRLDGAQEPLRRLAHLG